MGVKAKQMYVFSFLDSSRSWSPFCPIPSEPTHYPAPSPAHAKGQLDEPAMAQDMNANSNLAVLQETTIQISDSEPSNDSWEEIQGNNSAGKGDNQDNSFAGKGGNQGESFGGIGGNQGDSFGGIGGNQGDSFGGKGGNHGDSFGGKGGNQGDSFDGKGFKLDGICDKKGENQGDSGNWKAENEGSSFIWKGGNQNNSFDVKGGNQGNSFDGKGGNQGGSFNMMGGNHVDICVGKAGNQGKIFYEQGSSLGQNFDNKGGNEEKYLAGGQEQADKNSNISFCDICSRGFSRRYNMMQHRQLHFGIRQFTCNECGKRFARQDRLKMHYLRHHTDINLDLI